MSTLEEMRIHDLEELLESERDRSSRYFDRMTSSAASLANIRRLLGVSGRPQAVTMARIEDLQMMAVSWVAYSDAHKERWDREIARQGGQV